MPRCVPAQSVQPVISEYTGTADGFFEVTNSGAATQVVLIEPKSFTIAEDGSGVFRPLDASIHVELSATSVRLSPLQTARIFYKVRATAPPAWLCIYAVFTSPKNGDGINVRIMLPHTVYVYQKQAFPHDAIQLSNVRYDAAQHRVFCDLENHSGFAIRAEQVEVTGPHHSDVMGGFPVLPELKRKLAINWTSEQAPQSVRIDFPGFQAKSAVIAARE